MSREGRKLPQNKKLPRVCHRCRNPRAASQFTRECPYICAECIGPGATYEESKELTKRDSMSLALQAIRGAYASENPDGPEFARAFIKQLGGAKRMGQMAARDFQKIRGKYDRDGKILSEAEIARRPGDAKLIRQWWELVYSIKCKNDEFRQTDSILENVKMEELEELVSGMLLSGVNAEYIITRMQEEADLRKKVLEAIHNHPDWVHELVAMSGPLIHAEASGGEEVDQDIRDALEGPQGA